jgi:hypothetical protein
MKTFVLVLFLCLGGRGVTAQTLGESDFLSPTVALHGLKTVWLATVVTDNVGGRDLTSSDMWRLAATELRKQGLTVEHQSAQAPFHYPAATIELNRLGSLRCGIGWYATWTIDFRVLIPYKLTSGKYLKWSTSDSTYGYALADQASDELLKQQTKYIQDFGDLYRKAN